jgi:lipoyl(octanoyl) transferase
VTCSPSSRNTDRDTRGTRSGVCEVSWRGRVEYGIAIAEMDAAVGNRLDGRDRDTVWLLEHDPVLTLGKSTRQGHIRVGVDALAERGVAVHRSTRGGDVTFHGPGQLVGYPIVNLRERKLGARCYVDALEEALIRTVAEYAITAKRVDGRTGVWVGNEKIAAIGVRISRGITSHGFALNVNTDLSYFDLIVPCGIPDAGVTSIDRLSSAPPMARVAEDFVRHFGDLLGSEMEWQTPRP